MLERFTVWRKLGGRSCLELEAREAEAFLILEDELAAARG